MVRWPGKVKPEERNELVNSIDIAPTILKACGMNIPKEMRGINILNKEELKKRKFTDQKKLFHLSWAYASYNVQTNYETLSLLEHPVQSL